jgi:hypothetical protein
MIPAARRLGNGVWRWKKGRRWMLYEGPVQSYVKQLFSTWFGRVTQLDSEIDDQDSKILPKEKFFR